MFPVSFIPMAYTISNRGPSQHALYSNSHFPSHSPSPVLRVRSLSFSLSLKALIVFYLHCNFHLPNINHLQPNATAASPLFQLSFPLKCTLALKSQTPTLTCQMHSHLHFLTIRTLVLISLTICSGFALASVSHSYTTHTLN